MKEIICNTFNLCNNPIYAYSDGSKTEKGKSTGVGYYIENWGKEKSIDIHQSYSVATAELVAISAALEDILAQDIDKKKDIIIMTDSEAAVKAIGNNSISAHKNEYAMEIRKKITNIDQNIENKRKVVVL